MQNNDIDSNNQIRTQTLTQGLSEACCHNIKEERPHSSPHHKPAHQPSATGKSLIPVNVLEALRAEQIFDQRELRKRATRKRIRSEQQRAASALKVSTFINQAQPAPTPSSVPSSPNCVTARVSEIVAERDLTLSVSSPLDAIPPSLHSVRIDDLDGLFCLRHQLSPPVRKALETCFAKIHWKNKDGSPGFFNKAVHKNRIPLDKHLAILCHAADAPDEDDLGIRQKLQCICECGLYSRLRKGKWICGFCCQDNHRCGLCNFKNIKDGLKTLLAAYSSRAYARGGTWFAITVSPRRLDQPAAAQAGTITPADWTFDASGFKFEASRPTKRIFVYPTAAVGDGDLEIQILTRQFLGAAKKALKNLYSSRRVDGLRARLENSIAFMPYSIYVTPGTTVSGVTVNDSLGNIDFAGN